MQSYRETPWTLAAQQHESIVQIIDEFQYLNSEICRDEAVTQVIDDLASGYMRTTHKSVKAAHFTSVPSCAQTVRRKI